MRSNERNPLTAIAFENRRRRYEARAQINRRHVQKYTSVYIFELRVCKANTLLTRITAIHGGNDTLRTVFSSGMDAACDNQKRCFGSAETRSQNYTRMYSFGADTPSIFKRPI